MKFMVIIHKAEEGGYCVEVPALPGCYSQGETIEEAITDIKEAIQLHIEVMREEGKEIPEEKELIVAQISMKNESNRTF